MKPFVAIDFETADQFRDSACAVGLVRVEDGKIAYRESALIRPPRSMSSVNQAVHGLTWADVRDQPPFAHVWPKLAPILNGATALVAHNAPFDKSVLSACCLAANLPVPKQDWVCTLAIAKQKWPKPAKNSLPDVCQRLGIAFTNHHEAGADAEAAARVFIALETRTPNKPAPSQPKPKPEPEWVPTGEVGAILAEIPPEHRTPTVLRLMRDAEQLGPLHAADLVRTVWKFFDRKAPGVPFCPCGRRASTLCCMCTSCIADLP